MGLRTNLYAIKKNDLQIRTSKIDNITFCGEAHTQESFRESLLILTVIDTHPRVFDINFSR